LKPVLHFLFLAFLSYTALANEPHLTNFGSKGWILTQDYFQLLPSGEDMSSVIDYWHPGGVSVGPATAGIDKLNPTYFYTYGGSTFHNKWFLNEFNITDPSRQGTPLFPIPFHVIQAINISTLHRASSEKKGIILNHTYLKDQSQHVRIKYGLPVGGAYLIPDGLRKALPTVIFDREPLKRFPEFGDAWKQMRTLNTDLDVSSTRVDDQRQLFANFSLQEITYPYPAKQRAALYNFVFLHSNKFKIIDHDVETLSLGGFYLNNSMGAKFGLPPINTLVVTSIYAHAQGTLTITKTQQKDVSLGSSLSLKPEFQTSHISDDEQLVRAFEIERTSAIEPQHPMNNTALIFQTFLTHKYNYPASFLELKADYTLDQIFFSFKDAPNTHIRFHEGVAEDVFLYDNLNSGLQEGIHRLNLSATYEHTFNFVTLNAHGSVFDHFGLLSGQNNTLNLLGASGRLSTLWKWGPLQLSVGGILGHNPLSHQVIQFLNTQRPTYERYGWTDDNDNGSYETQERDGILQRSGGLYHELGDFDFPYTAEIYVGTQLNFSSTWSITVNLLKKYFYNQLAATYTDSYSSSIIASEIFELTNINQKAIYEGIEVIIVGMFKPKKYFATLALSAFNFEGSSTFGNGIFYKDIGIIDELQADPSANQVIPDHDLTGDLAYMGKLSAGIYFFSKLIFSGTLRYRDGQPFDIHEIKRTHNGLVKVNVDDSPRFTQYLNLDFRLQYTFYIWDFDVTAILDIYNVLGSNTEIKEVAIALNNGTADRRAPVEAIPPRSLMVSLASTF
jgi:hypothetical protein